MKKIISIFVMFVLVLSGCGANQTKEIRFSWWGSNDRNNATLQAIDDYNASQDDVEIIPEYYDYGSYQTKLSTQISGGSEACVLQVDYHWINDFGADKFYDLNEYSDLLNLAGYNQDLLNTMNYDGKQVSLPSGPNVPVFIFNKTTFDKAGIEIPTSWEELEAAGPAMQEALGDTYYPFSTLMPYDLFYEYTYEATGNPIFDEDGNFNWTKDDILVGLNEYQKLIDDNVIPSTEQAPDEMTQGDPQWIDGEWAGAITWSGSVSSWQDSLQEGDELVVVPTLSMDGAKSTGKVIKPAMSYAIADNCEYKDESAEFLNWFVSSEQSTLDLGMTRGMVDNPDAIKILDENGMLEGPAYEAYVTTKDIDAAPMPLLSGDTNRVILDGLSNLRYGSKTPDEVADDIYAEFTK